MREERRGEGEGGRDKGVCRGGREIQGSEVERAGRRAEEGCCRERGRRREREGRAVCLSSSHCPACPTVQECLFV